MLIVKTHKADLSAAVITDQLIKKVAQGCGKRKTLEAFRAGLKYWAPLLRAM